MVEQIRLTRCTAFPGRTALFFFHKVLGILTALIDEITAQAEIAFLAGCFVQPDQCHFSHFVSGIALALVLFFTETRVDVIGKAAGGAQKLVLARSLIVGDRAFGQVTEAVQLMVVAQIGPRGVHAVDDVIGIQIAVVHLRSADLINRAVRNGLQLLVGVLRQRIGHSLDPLGKIRILEDEAVEAILLGMRRILRQRFKAAEGVNRRNKGRAKSALLLMQPGGSAEVVHAPAGRGFGHPVVEHFPLVRNHFLANQFHGALPEAVCNLDMVKRQRSGKTLFIHVCSPPKE